jgi:hypothetical protein
MQDGHDAHSPCLALLLLAFTPVMLLLMWTHR